MSSSQQRTSAPAAREGAAHSKPPRHESHDGNMHEREADRNAQAIGRRGAPCSITPVSAPSRDDGARAPSPVPASPGQSLDSVTRRFMHKRLGRDFGDVRIHADEAASRAAHEQQAHAYATGRHVVFGRGEYAPHTSRGRMLLAHELTHVAQQAHLPDKKRAPVQRMGFGQFFARLFGEGTFSDDELEVYLLRLESQPGIEDDFDSDNKARAVVRKGLHKDLPLEIRVKLINEMISGATGNDDEQAILKILEDASPLDREVLVERVGYERLDDNIHGDEFDRLMKMAAGMRRAGKQPVPTTWTMSYAVQGASELRNSVPAIEVLNLDATPDGEAAGRSVVQGQTVQSPSGSPQFLAGSFDHPRGKKGQGSLAFRVLPTDKNNKPIPDNGSAPEQLSAAYDKITYDKRLVDAHVDVSYDRLESPTTTEKSTGSSTTTGTETGRTDSESQKKGESTTKSQSQTLGSTEGRSQTHQENKSQTDTTGKSGTTTQGTSKTQTKGDSDTHSEQDSHSEHQRSHKQINIHLEGKVEGNLGDLLKSLAGKLITGGILGKFLDRAGKPGKILKRLINKFNPIDMLLEGVGDSFTLKGTLKGDMAAQWESETTDTHTTGDAHTDSTEDATTRSNERSDTQSSEKSSTKGTEDSSTTSRERSRSETQGREDTQSAEREKGSSQSSKSSRERTDSTGSETSSERSDTSSSTKSNAQRDSTKDTDTTGTKTTERPWIPVIKERTLTFTVK